MATLQVNANLFSTVRTRYKYLVRTLDEVSLYEDHPAADMIVVTIKSATQCRVTRYIYLVTCHSNKDLIEATNRIKRDLSR